MSKKTPVKGHLRQKPDGGFSSVKSHLRNIRDNISETKERVRSTLKNEPEYHKIDELDVDEVSEELENDFKNAGTHHERKTVIKRLSTYQMYAVRMSFAGGSKGRELGDKAEKLRQLRLKLDPGDTYFEELYPSE